MVKEYIFLNNYTIIKKLGKGVYGTVFLVKNNINNDKYDMKVEKIFKKDLEKNYKSFVYRELDFSKTMYDKYPLHFFKIYHYGNKICNYEHKMPNFFWNNCDIRKKNFLNKLYSSPYCSIKITNIIDDTLHNIIFNLNDINIIYDLQIISLSLLKRFLTKETALKAFIILIPDKASSKYEIILL